MLQGVPGCPLGFHASLLSQFALPLGPSDLRQQQQHKNKWPLTDCFTGPHNHGKSNLCKKALILHIGFP